MRAAWINLTPVLLHRVNGPSGFPQGPRIMEGPLVSDTTEILSGAPSASEDAPAAAAATASTSKSRSRGGTGLSSLLMPELQRIAQTLAIPGAGRMRKNQLIEAIEARQGGGPRPDTTAARQGSDQRAVSAGADAARAQKQDAMEPDTHSQPGIGASAPSGLGDVARSGIGADGTGTPSQQQLSFYEEADAAARRDSATRASAAKDGAIQDGATQDGAAQDGAPLGAAPALSATRGP
jgi:transcription termination factor Rho